MRTRARIGLAVCCVVVAAASGCGNRDRVATPGAPATAAGADAATAASTAGDIPTTSPTGSSPDTVTLIEPGTSPGDTYTDGTASNSSVVDDPSVATAASTIALGLPIYPQPADDAIVAANAVSGSDPVPPEVDSSTDPAAAEVAVRYGIQHWILLDIDKNVRASLIENGEANVDHIDAQLHAASGLVGCARLAIDGVQFTDAEHAIVQFRMLCGQAVSSYFPNETIGGAVFVDGSWRIDRHTLCFLAFAVGQDCAGSVTNPPTPPAALVVTGVPTGWASSSLYPNQQTSSNVIDLPGERQWTAGLDLSIGFFVKAEVLKGISELIPDDMASVLTANRFGATNGMSVTVGDRPGRIEVDGPQIALVFIRADDVAVQIHATGMAEADVLAVAASIQAA